jgi:hypothetical protein
MFRWLRRLAWWKRRVMTPVEFFEVSMQPLPAHKAYLTDAFRRYCAAKKGK